MTAPAPTRHRWLGRRLYARRSQAGITLVEILMTLGIATIIIAPVGSWLILALSSNADTAGRFSDSAQQRLVNTYVTRDVASAELVEVDAASLAAQPQCGATPGTAVMRVIDYEDKPKQIDYVTVSTGGKASLYRRACLVSSRSTLLDEVEVLRGVKIDPAGSAPAATCPTATCRQVTFTAVLDSGAAISVGATRRATLDPSLVGASGNWKPYARIAPVTQGGNRPSFTVTLDGSGSGDIDGGTLSYAWSVSPSASIDDVTAAKPVFTFGAVGTYTITLTVSDGTDSATATYSVDVVNQPPVAKGSVDVSQGTVDGPGGTPPGTVFNFDATPSADVDGDGPVSYAWDFGGGAVITSGSATVTNPSVRFAESAAVGDREVKLTVTDALGAKSVERVAIKLSPLGGEPPPAAGSFTVVSSAGPLVNTAKGPRAGTASPGSPVTVSFVAAPGTPTPTWSLSKGGTQIDTAASHTFTYPEYGTYTIEMTPLGGPTVSQQFRINSPPTADFSASIPTGDAPLTVGFTDKSSDPDGSVDQWAWNFGWFDNWVSAAPSPSQLFTNNGRYSVTLIVRDDDGAFATSTQALTIGASLPKPPPPVFSTDGTRVSWPATPGATSYVVTVTYTGTAGGTACTGTWTPTVAPSAAPSLVVMPPPQGTTCDTINAVTVQYQELAGSLHADSDPVTR